MSPKNESRPAERPKENLMMPEGYSPRARRSSYAARAARLERLVAAIGSWARRAAR